MRLKSQYAFPISLLVLASCGGPPGENGATAAPEMRRNGVQAAAPSPQLPPAASVNPAPFLPAAGAHQARAMAITAPPEMQRLAERIRTAMRARPDWFRAYAAQHPQGELPWHSNLGVSEAEYRRFLALTHELGLAEVDRVTFTVTRRPDGGLAFAAAGQAAPLNGIIVYPAGDRVETPRGRLTRRSAIDNHEPRSPTGPWQGVQWSNIGSGGRPVRLAFGRRAAGDLILYYDFGPTDAETVILLYPAATS
jgi:hypothetical protein